MVLRHCFRLSFTFLSVTIFITGWDIRLVLEKFYEGFSLQHFTITQKLYSNISEVVLLLLAKWCDWWKPKIENALCCRCLYTDAWRLSSTAARGPRIYITDVFSGHEAWYVTQYHTVCMSVCTGTSFYDDDKTVWRFSGYVQFRSQNSGNIISTDLSILSSLSPLMLSACLEK